MFLMILIWSLIILQNDPQKEMRFIYDSPNRRIPLFCNFPLYAIRYNYNFGELRRGKNIIYVWWFILILIIRWLILILSFLIDHVILFFDYLHQFPFVSHMIHSNLFVWTFLRVLFSPDRSIHHLGIYYLILRTLIKSDSYNRSFLFTLSLWSHPCMVLS